MENSNIEPRIRIEDSDWWGQMASILADFLGDHRINGEVRKEYEERFKQVKG
jgi:hypothetical protein